MDLSLLRFLSDCFRNEDFDNENEELCLEDAYSMYLEDDCSLEFDAWCRLMHIEVLE